LSKSVVQQRPSAIAILIYVPGNSVTIRFLGVPDQAYTVNLTYQALSIQFFSFTTISSANTAGGNTIYTGIFTPSSFESNDEIIIAGFTNPLNNGVFLFVSATTTTLTVANPFGVAETPAVFASAINGGWTPIPDQYSDVYNNLFLSEAFQAVSEDAEAARYRQRGVAALIAKAEGLTESQINIFRQQWLSRDAEVQANQLRAVQWSQARGV
jgi:hypothetical protein